MPRDRQPRLTAAVFTSSILANAQEDASVFVENIYGGRSNFQSIETMHHYGMSTFIVTVWWWKW